MPFLTCSEVAPCEEGKKNEERGMRNEGDRLELASEKVVNLFIDPSSVGLQIVGNLFDLHNQGPLF